MSELKRYGCPICSVFCTLSYAEAEKIWVEVYALASETFHKRFNGVENITAATLAKNVDEEKSGITSSSTKRRSYLKEDGISKAEGLRQQKTRIGLL